MDVRRFVFRMRTFAVDADVAYVNAVAEAIVDRATTASGQHAG